VEVEGADEGEYIIAGRSADSARIAALLSVIKKSEHFGTSLPSEEKSFPSEYREHAQNTSANCRMPSNVPAQ
jgi:hypothetical protein